MKQNELLLSELIERYPCLEACKADIVDAYSMLKQCFTEKKKVLLAGNGGSAADAEHIVGELMKGFVLERRPDEQFINKLIEADADLGKQIGDKIQGALPAIALTNHISLSTAFLNDVDAQYGFAQQVNGYGAEGDVFWGITTSGNSKNIIYANIVAKAKGMHTIALTGRDGGKIRDMADITIIVPEQETYKIQELHLPIYHCLCRMLEEEFFE